MSRFSLPTLALSLTACVSAHGNRPVATAAQSQRASCSASDPLFIRDGVVLESPCGAAQKGKAAECRSAAPIYVIDGVRLFGKDEPPTCDKPASGPSL